jgi:hypothetical protein
MCRLCALKRCAQYLVVTCFITIVLVISARDCDTFAEGWCYFSDAADEAVEKEVDRQYKQVVVQWCAALAKLVYAEN